jgi:polar amino acid transport system substrate-binding protein
MQSARSKRNAALRRGFGCLTAVLLLAGVAPAGAQTLDGIKTAGVLKLGYEEDARPFSFKDDGGNPAGYAIGLCQQIAEETKTQLSLPDLKVEWVPVKVEERFSAVSSGQVNLFCGAATETLSRRQEVSFSIPIFPSGVGAMLSDSSPLALRTVLTYGRPTDRPIWRGAPARTVLENETFAFVEGTTAQTWLAERLASFKLPATVVPVKTNQEGIDAVLNGTATVFFSDLPVLLDAAARNSGNLVVLDRRFTYETLAIVVPRSDEDLRLLVDGALSKTYRGEGFRESFLEWFGPPDEAMIAFFQGAALPE